MGNPGGQLKISLKECDIFLKPSGFARKRLQPSYVCLSYCGNEVINITIPSTDLSMDHLVLPEVYSFTIIQGEKNIQFGVWKEMVRRRTDTDFVGSGEIQLDKVLSLGYDDSSWVIQKGDNKRVGELSVILRYPNASSNSFGPLSSSSENFAPPAGYPPRFAAPVNPYALPPSPYVVPPWHAHVHPYAYPYPYQFTPPTLQYPATYPPPPTPPSNHGATQFLVPAAALTNIASGVLGFIGSSDVLQSIGSFIGS